MKLTKKQLCTILAAVVTICFVISLISLIYGGLAAAHSGGAFPMGMVWLTLVTGLCTFMIWRGVMEMD